MEWREHIIIFTKWQPNNETVTVAKLFITPRHQCSKTEVTFQQSYSDLEGPRDIRVRKMASDVPSSTPTAIIAG